MQINTHMYKLLYANILHCHFHPVQLRKPWKAILKGFCGWDSFGSSVWLNSSRLSCFCSPVLCLAGFSDVLFQLKSVAPLCAVLFDSFCWLSLSWFFTTCVWLPLSGRPFLLPCRVHCHSSHGGQTESLTSLLPALPRFVAFGFSARMMQSLVSPQRSDVSSSSEEVGETLFHVAAMKCWDLFNLLCFQNLQAALWCENRSFGSFFFFFPELLWSISSVMLAGKGHQTWSWMKVIHKIFIYVCAFPFSCIKFPVIIAKPVPPLHIVPGWPELLKETYTTVYKLTCDISAPERWLRAVMALSGLPRSAAINALHPLIMAEYGWKMRVSFSPHV